MNKSKIKSRADKIDKNIEKIADDIIELFYERHIDLLMPDTTSTIARAEVKQLIIDKLVKLCYGWW